MYPYFFRIFIRLSYLIIARKTCYPVTLCSLSPKLNLCVLILANNVNLRLIKKYADFIKHHIFLGHNPKLSSQKTVDRGSTFSLPIQPSIIESQETSLPLLFYFPVFCFFFALRSPFQFTLFSI